MADFVVRDINGEALRISDEGITITDVGNGQTKIVFNHLANSVGRKEAIFGRPTTTILRQMDTSIGGIVDLRSVQK